MNGEWVNNKWIRWKRDEESRQPWSWRLVDMSRTSRKSPKTGVGSSTYCSLVYPPNASRGRKRNPNRLVPHVNHYRTSIDKARALFDDDEPIFY